MNVRTLCLGILSLKEASGYEIKKDVEDGLFSHFIDASYGSIYPALNQLAIEGFVTVRSEEQTGKPDKKVYSITEPGKNALARAISVVPTRDKYKSEFLFQMLLKDYMTPETMLVAIQKQLDDLNEDIACIAECDHRDTIGNGARFVGEYGNAVLTAGVKYLEYRKAELLRQMASQAAE
jgi:PadR family transcriptional regulator, regulatory protein AphA